MPRHLLVTNDFPPKVGGIQTYLWELWRRLPADDVTVLTTPHREAAAFDASQPFPVMRTGEGVLLPTPALARRIDRLAAELGAELVVLDPAIPLGLLGPSLRHPYALVLHGSELLGRLPVGSALMGKAVAGARHVIAAGGYPASEARRVAGERTPPVTCIPPGVDIERFRPLSTAEREAARARFGLPRRAPLVLGLSRLVPRKGFHLLMEAAGRLADRHPELVVAVAGSGREEKRLRALAASSPVDVRLLGRVPGDDLPALYGCADVFAMLCHDRWAGVEVEGFGIVFLEAAACGVPQVAGDSGGASDAVVDGETGVVVRRPMDLDAVSGALGRLLANPAEAAAMGRAARERAVRELTYDVLAARLHEALERAALR